MFANLSPLPVKSARRKATVTISAPLASMAAAMSSPDANLPVPMIRREANSRLAMRSRWGLSVMLRRGFRTGLPLAIAEQDALVAADAGQCVLLFPFRDVFLPELPFHEVNLSLQGVEVVELAFK